MDREETLFRMFGRFFPQGAILFSEQDPGDEMYYIQSGTVRISNGTGDARREVNLGPGDVTGVEALVSREPRRVMAEVMEDSRLLVFDARSLAKIVRNAPEMSTTVLADLMQAIDGAWDDLRRWQLFFYLDKLAIHLNSSWPSEGRTVTEVSKITEIEEGIIGRIFEELVRAGVLRKSEGAYGLGGSEALGRLAELQRKIDAALRKKT